MPVAPRFEATLPAPFSVAGRPLHGRAAWAFDLLGDLTLAGGPLVGRIVARRPTHELAYAFVATPMQCPGAWVSCGC